MRSHTLMMTPKMGSLTTECQQLLENEQICQELDARQSKIKIEAEQDWQAWSQWDKRRVILVCKYKESTHKAQHSNTDYCQAVSIKQPLNSQMQAATITRHQDLCMR